MGARCSTNSASEGIEFQAITPRPEEPKPPESPINLQDMLEGMGIEALEKKSLEVIKNVITPKALLTCKSDTNVLFLTMKASFKLRCLADKESPNKDDITKLAHSVEELTTGILAPLREDETERKKLGEEMDPIIETAIELEQKKFFVDPVIDAEMNHKWYGSFSSGTQPWKWLLLHAWCLLGVVFFPILYIFYVRTEKYKQYFETPYFVFVRDTLSYLTLLGLHVAICLAPSSISFSGLEWAILVYFTGRLLVEAKQISKINAHMAKQAELDAQTKKGPIQNAKTVGKTVGRYLSDRWNALDAIILLVYLATLVLRVVTWAGSHAMTNNRVLVVSGYLYGCNTMLLTFRASGHLMETSKRVGTIQIALFNIMVDVIAIFGQFIATILAFSTTITKIYMAEKSFIADENSGKEPVCKASGISCWWTITTHLSWSLLGVAEVESLESVDYTSEAFARVLYAAFLIMGVVLLVNMLIALLSNTYQRVEDNALMEWSFKKAVTIQTYMEYDPVPVPFNIVSSVVRGLLSLRQRSQCCKKEEGDGSPESEDQIILFMIVDSLKEKYLRKNGFSFPSTDEKKQSQVAYDTENMRQMVNHIAQRTFVAHDCDAGALQTGPQGWFSSEGIRIEGCLLTCEGTGKCLICPQGKPAGRHVYGARYRSPFSTAFPHFEVLIQETEDVSWLEVGIVSDDSEDTHYMPGRKVGSVGYRSNDGKISFDGKSNETDAIAHRGDFIGLTVVFEELHQANQKAISPQHEANQVAASSNVKVVLTLNGSRITRKEICVCYKPGQNLYPYIGMKGKGIKVLSKMRAGDNPDACHKQLPQIPPIEALEEKLDKVLKKLEEIEKRLDHPFLRKLKP